MVTFASLASFDPLRPLGTLLAHSPEAECPPNPTDIHWIIIQSSFVGFAHLCWTAGMLRKGRLGGSRLLLDRSVGDEFNPIPFRIVKEQ